MNFSIRLSKEAKADIAKLKTENRRFLVKLWDLIINISETPFDGIGQPEALRGDLSGLWSRRINGEHRLVYRIKTIQIIENDERLERQVIEIISCHGHYEF